MRNKKIALRIQAALKRNQARQDGTAKSRQDAIQKLDKVRSIVERRLDGERNWKLEEIAERENIGYMSVHRALKGKLGWLAYGRTIRVTDSLYRAWLTSIALGVSLDDYLNLPQAS